MRLYLTLQFKRTKRKRDMEKGNEELDILAYVRTLKTLEPHHRNKVNKIFFFLLKFIIQISLHIVIYIVFKQRLSFVH